MKLRLSKKTLESLYPTQRTGAAAEDLGHRKAARRTVIPTGEGESGIEVEEGQEVEFKVERATNLVCSGLMEPVNDSDLKEIQARLEKELAECENEREAIKKAQRTANPPRAFSGEERLRMHETKVRIEAIKNYLKGSRGSKSSPKSTEEAKSNG